MRNQSLVLPGAHLRTPVCNHSKNANCDLIKAEEDQRTEPGPSPEPREACPKHQDMECVRQPRPTEYNICDQIKSLGGRLRRTAL